MITTLFEDGYVVNRVGGNITIRELLNYAQNNVASWVSEPVLWDLSNSTMTEDASDYAAIRAIVGNIHQLVEKRKGRKTAFVAPDPLTYGMLRMAITIVECYQSHSIASIFSDIETAYAWLKEA